MLRIFTSDALPLSHLHVGYQNTNHSTASVGNSTDRNIERQLNALFTQVYANYYFLDSFFPDIL